MGEATGDLVDPLAEAVSFLCCQEPVGEATGDLFDPLAEARRVFAEMDADG